MRRQRLSRQRRDPPSLLCVHLPQIIEDLALHKYGFEYLVRDPSSFTPTLPSSRWGGKSLLLGASDEGKDWESIAQVTRMSLCARLLRSALAATLSAKLPVCRTDATADWAFPYAQRRRVADTGSSRRRTLMRSLNTRRSCPESERSSRLCSTVSATVGPNSMSERQDSCAVPL